MKRLPPPLRVLLGMALIALAAALCSWGAFNLSRGPSQCGGYGPACPPGLAPAIIGAVLGLFALAPAGAALCAARVQGAPQAAAGLCLTAAAAGVYVARFVALPVREATVPTWIVAGLLGALGVLFLFAAFRVPPDEHERMAAFRVAAAAGAGTPPRGSAAPRPRTGGRTATPRAPIDQLHDLLAHGLATGTLATDGAARSSGRATDVVQLLDLHRRGVIGDAELRAALAALRRA